LWINQGFDEEDSYKLHNHPRIWVRRDEIKKIYIFNSTFKIIRKIFQVIVLSRKESSRNKEFRTMS